MSEKFIRLAEPLHGWIDRKLGYFGDHRFVLFYYELRGQEVIWKDGRSYGFGTGGWCAFAEHIAPLAERYGVNLCGRGADGTHALIIDRLTRTAYFAPRAQAERFLAEHQAAAVAALG